MKGPAKIAAMPAPRRGMPSPRLDEAEFKRRFLAPFQDAAFEPLTRELERVADAAWDAYAHSRKSPRTRKAGAEFADPDYDLSTDWLAARDAIAARPAAPGRDGRPRAMRTLLGFPIWPVVIGYIVALLGATLNMLVHTHDAWTSVMPWGLVLSAVVVIILLVASGFWRATRVRDELITPEVVDR